MPRSEMKAATVGGKIYLIGGAWTEMKNGEAVDNYTTGFTTEYDPGGGGAVTSAHFNLDGLRVGGGAEFAISRNLFFRAEGRYTEYHNGGNRGALLGALGFRF